MTINKSIFTSNKQDWETPQWLFDKINRYFNFTLDACATKQNAKVANYYSLDEGNNSLLIEWYKPNTDNIIWCNPPYNQLYQWAKKCYDESQKGCTVVLLCPARTDTKMWHEYLSKARVTLLKGRLHFNNSKNASPFPSCIVVFDKLYDPRILNQENDILFKE